VSDRYLSLVNSPVGGAVVSRLGLPRPAMLRRHEPGAPLLPGPALLSGTGLADVLKGMGVDVRDADDGDTRWAALLYDATGVASIGELARLRDFLRAPLRRLGPSGRVVVLARPPAGVDPAVDATRQALEGIVRSLAKELRAGATANLVLLEGRRFAGVSAALPAVRACRLRGRPGDPRRPGRRAGGPRKAPFRQGRPRDGCGTWHRRCNCRGARP
jgi:3-oxoacyl-[acyl-carrier protein] reductase